MAKKQWEIEQLRRKQAIYEQAMTTFTNQMSMCADWRHEFYGAAYTTRLVQAIEVAREACTELEKKLIELNEIPVPEEKK